VRLEPTRYKGTALSLPGGVLCLFVSSCYVGAGLGGTLPLSAQQNGRSGGIVAGEMGFQYDYKRLLRVMYLGSGQMFGGAVSHVGDATVVSPFNTGLQLDVTLVRRDWILYRLTTQGWLLNDRVLVGTGAADPVEQPGSRTFGALLGGTVQLLGDTTETGPLGLNLTVGMLVQTTHADAIGRRWTAAPMVVLGADYSWQIFRCMFVDDQCSHYIMRAKN
jgi:hypothetical protein